MPAELVLILVIIILLAIIAALIVELAFDDEDSSEGYITNFGRKLSDEEKDE